jgi:hypothetical protein
MPVITHLPRLIQHHEREFGLRGVLGGENLEPWPNLQTHDQVGLGALKEALLLSQTLAGLLHPLPGSDNWGERRCQGGELLYRMFAPGSVHGTLDQEELHTNMSR